MCLITIQRMCLITIYTRGCLLGSLAELLLPDEGVEGLDVVLYQPFVQPWSNVIKLYTSVFY
jgi:hypothetical protein